MLKESFQPCLRMMKPGIFKVKHDLLLSNVMLVKHGLQKVPISAVIGLRKQQDRLFSTRLTSA